MSIFQQENGFDCSPQPIHYEFQNYNIIGNMISYSTVIDNIVLVNHQRVNIFLHSKRSSIAKMYCESILTF